jgi:ABC-type amino acid transport substrate-binding protein
MGLLAALAAQCGDLPPDMARILGRGELRVALHREDSPFFRTGADGELDGLDLALARDIASSLGVTLRLDRRAATYDEVVEVVARGDADVAISLLSRTLERARRVRFTTAYAELRQALLLNRLGTAPLRLEADPVGGLDRPGVRIGTIAGSAYCEYAQEGFPAAELVTYGTWQEAIEALVAGEIHALFYDELEVRGWQKAHPEMSLYIKAVLLDSRRDYICMAVGWQDTHWLAWLNLYLQGQRETGALDRLKQRYLEDR